MPQPIPVLSAFPTPCTGFAPEHMPPSQAALPLQGITLLLVEDSRFSSDAMRLICQRAGARLRRADTLQSARAHLRVYRPDAVIIDLGLPDGRGEILIHELLLSARRPSVILGTSGSASGKIAALAAGADGYIDKPISSFSGFCAFLREKLALAAPPETATVDSPISPDPLALQDDLAQAAAALQNHPNAAQRRYLGGFLLGIARLAQDRPLADASLQLSDPAADISVARLIHSRIAHGVQAFVKARE